MFNTMAVLGAAHHLPGVVDGVCRARCAAQRGQGFQRKALAGLDWAWAGLAASAAARTSATAAMRVVWWRVGMIGCP